MARVEVGTQSWGVVISDAGVPLKDATVTLSATVYTAATGGTTVSPVKSGSDGVLPGFVEEGTFTLTEPDGQVRQVEAVSGGGAARLDSVESGVLNAIITKEAPINPRHGNWGAVGDGVADDTAALAAAFAAVKAAAGGDMVWDDGSIFKTTGTLELPRGLHLHGPGQNGRAVIRNAVSDIFQMGDATSAFAYFVIEGIKAEAQTGGGHVFVSGGKGVEQGTIRNCWFTQANAAKSLVRSVNQGWLLDTLFEQNRMEHVDGATVPGVHLVSANGDINANRWLLGRYYYSGEYFFHLENTGAANYLYGNVWDEPVFEICRGGLIKILSGFSNEVRRCGNYDMAVVGASTRDGIVFGQSATSLISRKNEVKGYLRAAGALGAGLYDVKLNASDAEESIVENVDGASLDAKIDLGPNAGTHIVLRNGITIDNLDYNTNGVLLGRGAAAEQNPQQIIGGKRLIKRNAAPTTGTWAVGDRAENQAPAVGSPKAWVCTVAGTPGTWVSEGNL